uniref:Protein binding protein n=1 Tax=Rhizophora mucronata TaxID=61149 RepID=A0A2P2IVZ9_RHIMU
MAASREVSTMIKQGFLSDPTLSFSPSRTLSRVPNSTNSKTLLSPPHFTPSTESTRSSQHPTLLQMMSEEEAFEQTRQRSQSKISKIVKEFENLNNCGMGLGDVRLTVVGRDGLRISMDVHKRILLEKSGFFREKLGGRDKGVVHSVEISECDDVEVYLETLVLMYSDDLKKSLMGEDVTKVLELLKVCHIKVNNSCFYMYISFFLSFFLLVPCIYCSLFISLALDRVVLCSWNSV